MHLNAFNLATFLPYQLVYLSERISQRLAAEYHTTYGLTRAEWRVLAHLCNSETVSIRDIQQDINLEKSRISRSVSRLEKNGYVQKMSHETDARLLKISLTAKGKDILNTLIPTIQDVEKQLKKSISSKDMKTFYKVMEHLHTTLDDDTKAPTRR